jgi:hypothetical protein
MFFTQSTFIGIDPTAGQRPFAYAALDGDLKLLALGQAEMDEVLAFVAGQRRAFVAVSAPRQPNLGLMSREDVRETLTPTPRPGRWTNFRLSEYLLRQHNITIPKTSASADDCPGWMQTSFRFYRHLYSLGYQAYPVQNEERQCMEVYPYACYTLLLGQPPFPKYTLEGRLQRQLLLYEQKVNVPDAMRFFEEITRNRLLHGVLSDESIYSPYELDALVAAYTAWLAAMKPDQITRMGDPEEGEIILPCANLKNKY